uniref:(northern house mosquito) hypothetical protein n=1 Tax=Culex pipiens TaxID=7175 RepID=A0A8D8DK67_CULPI
MDSGSGIFPAVSQYLPRRNSIWMCLTRFVWVHLVMWITYRTIRRLRRPESRKLCWESRAGRDRCWSLAQPFLSGVLFTFVMVPVADKRFAQQISELITSHLRKSNKLFSFTTRRQYALAVRCCRC